MVGGDAAKMRLKMRLAALAVVCALLVTSFPLALATNEVAMLGESGAAEEERRKDDALNGEYPYEQWAKEDQRLLSSFIPPPPEAKSAKENAETLRWAKMRGLEQGLNDAKLATNVHKMRKQDGEREESDREALQLYIQQAPLKEKAMPKKRQSRKEDSTAGRKGNERQTRDSSQGRYSIGGSRNGTRTGRGLVAPVCQHLSGI